MSTYKKQLVFCVGMVWYIDAGAEKFDRRNIV